MKIITFELDGKECPGVVHKGNFINLSNYFPNVMSIIENSAVALKKIKDIKINDMNLIELKKEQLLSPIPQVKRNIICLGWNYLEHFEERFRQDIDLPNKPVVFTKATESIAGPYEKVEFSRNFTNKFDYEAELAVIIGKKGHCILEEEALDYVFGYTCANDLSARDVQNEHGGQWFLGKSMDKSCPLGPWIVTKDEIEDVQNLDIQCKVNGQIVQSSNTNLMMFPVKKIIAELSKAMTLLPGDIILTGTPSGVGFKRNPPILLKQDDVVEVSISQIGSIENKIAEKSLIVQK